MNTIKSKPSSLTIFLADGVPDGLRTVVKAGWIGHFIVCPRSRFIDARNGAEFDLTGVYILCGPSDDSDLPTIYIGEGDPTRPRLEQHYRQKDFWTSLILFTANNQLNKAYVQYLESRLVALARAAKRCVLDNGNEPQLPTLAIAETAAMEGFLDEMLPIFPLLGLTVFEVPSQSPKPVPGKPSPVTTSGPPDTTLYLKARGVKASGYDRSEGFVVLAGSEAVGDKKCRKNMPPSALTLRNGLVKQGVLVPDADHFKFTQDYSLNSPSQAAAVVMGCSANGLAGWRDAQGRPLKDIRVALPGDAPRLPLPQLRILQALLSVEGVAPSMSRAELCKKVGFTQTAGTFTRALNGIRAGSGSGKPHKGLLDNGLVVEVKRDEDNEAAYQITTEGIKAIEDYLKNRGSLPPRKDKTLSTNRRYQTPDLAKDYGPYTGPSVIDHKTVAKFSNDPTALPKDFTKQSVAPGIPCFLEYDHSASRYKVLASWKYGRTPAAGQSAPYTITVVDGSGATVSTYDSSAARDIAYIEGRATQVLNWLDGELKKLAAKKPANVIVDDPHDLNRFVQAQARVYDRALSEVRSGRKRTHWMWFIFPQVDRVGSSSTSWNYRYYAIKSIAEAKAYLSHPVLRQRLMECAEAALSVQGRTAHEIFDSPDDKKLRSCATLFASVSQPGSVFHQLLDKYYRGERDSKTLRLLGIASDVK